jgi:hypothetical protein
MSKKTTQNNLAMVMANTIPEIGLINQAGSSMIPDR